jgi:hypothetical protein
VRWLRAELPGATAAFTTRVGGVSEPPYDELNVAILTGDERAAVGENRRRVCAAVGRDPAGVLIARQIHGGEVRWHDRPQEPSIWVEAGPAPIELDGHATANGALTPLVFVADCLPIALAGPGGVAMVHGGWRGLAAGIVSRGAELVEASAAAIGPGIGRCCYEVGDEVLERFTRLGPGIAEGRMLDLVEVARRLLEEAGVPQIEAAGLCTSCEAELFYSHRRDGERTGRQAGLVWLEDRGGG